MMGIMVGLYISPLRPSNCVECSESISVLTNLKVFQQEMMFEFYKDYYCENSQFRLVDINYNGTLFTGGFCDKNTVLVLGEEFPPLPIFILKLEE